MAEEKVTHFITENEMVNNLDIDESHWINRDMIRFTKRNVYEKTKETIQYVPSWLEDLYFTCEYCNQHSQPDWLEKRRPLMPYVTSKQLHMVPQRNSFVCSYCKNDIWFKVPHVEHQTIRNFYGDEAYRELGANYILMTYSFIGEPASAEEKDAIVQSFYKIKEKYVPSKKPKKWTLHMKDIFSQRSKHKYLSHITLPQIIEMVSEIGQLLSDNYGKIRIYNSSSIFRKTSNFKRKKVEQLKSVVYFPIVLYSTYEHTQHGVSPCFILEREQKNGWATSLFDRGKLTLAWPYITHLNPIPQPKFVLPDFDPFLELADVVSFVIARYLLKTYDASKGIKTKLEFDPRILGKVHYSGLDNKMRTVYEVSTGYPLKSFFKGTKLENVHFSD